MTPHEAVTELMAFRTKVIREMPHVECGCYPTRCTCFKMSLNAALLRAEIQLRSDIGMEPF